MEKISIITPGFLPVPAVYGGAIEVLIETLIDGNEREGNKEIDLYTIWDERLNINTIFNKTNIIIVKISIVDKLLSIIYNRSHRLFSIFRNEQKDNFISPYAVKIWRLVRKKEYSKIIVENNLAVFNALSRKKNLVFHLHNDILGQDKPLYQCKLMLKKSIKVIVVSNYLKNRLISIMPDKKVDVLWNCVDLELFNGEKFIKSSSEQCTKFIYCGRLSEEKGVYELAKAFLRLSEKYSNVHLTIVGKSIFNEENEFISEYEQKIRNILESSKNILFTGFVSHKNIPRYIFNSDCVIIPTVIEESFGVLALEAMALKKAIIATRSGGIIEVIDEKCAIIIDKNNIEYNLYNAMENIHLDKYNRIMMGLRGYDKVNSINDFDKKNYYRNFIKCLNDFKEE